MTNLNIQDIDLFFLENPDLDDQSISTGGGDFKRELLPAKGHAVRLVGYTEVGVHTKKKFQSEETNEVDTVRLTFEVLSKDGIRLDDAGKAVGARRLYMECKRSTHEKSTMRKLFELMREGDTTITHFAQMIGTKAWKLQVNWEANRTLLQNKKARTEAVAAAEAAPDNKDLRVWEVWKTNGVPNLSPAVNAVMDEDGEDTGEVIPMKVPAVIGKLEFFLWDTPVAEHWASLFIEGDYEKKDASGAVVKVSKNRVQEQAIAANNYDGSALQAMLDGTAFVAPEVLDAEDEDEAPKKEKKSKKPNKDKKAEDTSEDTSDEVGDDKSDEMDEMGL